MPSHPIENILHEVRSFYAAGKKSGNKVYAKSDFVSNADWDAHSRKWSVRMMMGNLFRNRNKNAALSQANRPAPPNGQSLHDWARAIYNGGARAEFTSGNCGEMAAVAAMLAVTPQYGYRREWARLGIIGAPGDHVFCILSMQAPTWTKASDMTGAPGASGAYVIDPWMNIACAAESYWTLAQRKVEKWASDGKRIWWNGPGGGGWYNPSGPYAAAFGSGPLGYAAI